MAVEAQAKRFEADPEAFMVYVVRSSWADTRHVIAVMVDDREALETLPYSMIRMRLRPGAHRISFEFEGKRIPVEISGIAGDIRLVRLVGEVWLWGSTYDWELGPEKKFRKLAARSRLVADINAYP